MGTSACPRGADFAGQAAFLLQTKTTARRRAKQQFGSIPYHSTLPALNSQTPPSIPAASKVQAMTAEAIPRGGVK
jgi:hypothetical protein